MYVKAVIAYDGSHYYGFQKQTSTSQTIVGVLEKALHDLHIETTIVGSGRTDAGVHATGQVIHFEIPPFWSDLKRLKRYLNLKLEHIYIKHISCVSQAFHARFSAKRRVYRYIFKTTEPSIFEKCYISHYDSFDPTLLKEALRLFEGEHDFKYFHKTGSVTHTTIRTIYKTTYRQRGAYHYLYFTANGFLRSQIRMMVEGVMHVAQGKLSKKQLQEQLLTEKKYLTKPAKPEGLYLARILY